MKKIHILYLALLIILSTTISIFSYRIGFKKGKRSELLGEQIQKCGISQYILRKLKTGDTNAIVRLQEFYLWGSIPYVYEFKETVSYADVKGLEKDIQHAAYYFENHPRREKLAKKNMTFEELVERDKEKFKGETNSAAILEAYDEQIHYANNYKIYKKEHCEWLENEKQTHKILKPYWDKKEK